MSFTLAEANKYSNTVLQQGVIELFVKDDPVLEKMPFVELLGNSLTYNVETTEPTVEFKQVGDTWTESTGTVTQSTATLKILGGDADVDNFLLKTRSNLQDIKAEVIASKLKAMKETFINEVWYGNTTYDAKGFQGVHSLINSETYNTINVGTNNTTPVLLSLSNVEKAIDMVKGFNPSGIFMAKSMRRYINKYLHGVGGITYMDAANGRIQSLFGTPVFVSDYIKITENCDKAGTTYYGYEYTTPAATSDGATSIFVVTFDPKGLCGLQAGSMTIEEKPALETKDASRFRIKWYCSMMIQNILSCTKISGIDQDGTVAV